LSGRGPRLGRIRMVSVRKALVALVVVATLDSLRVAADA
jgi:hypothetical protein